MSIDDDIALIGALHARPDILVKYPDLLEILALPNIAAGEAAVADFQSAAINRLRGQLEEARQEATQAMDGLRDKHSLTRAVQQLALQLMPVREFENLLQLLVQDLPAQLGIDLALLLVESPIAAAQEAMLSEAGLPEPESGIRFVLPHSLPISPEDEPRCVADAMEEPLAPGWELASNAAELLRSQALLPLDLPESGHTAALIIGTRQPGYFTETNAKAPLDFLAKTVAFQLDKTLQTSGLMESLG